MEEEKTKTFLTTFQYFSELVNMEEEKTKTDPVKKEKFFKSMNKAFKRHAMISASIEVIIVNIIIILIC